MTTRFASRVEHPDDRHPDECCRAIPEVMVPIARADRQGWGVVWLAAMIAALSGMGLISSPRLVG
jgi:hypothetical protein